MILSVAFVGFFALLFLRIPIAIALGLVGYVGFGVIVGFTPAARSVGTAAADTVLSYEFATIPMFVLMGNVIARSGISDELYETCQHWIGSLRGGLSLATIASCAGFSAVSGSSLATVATMAKVSMPPMQRYGYSNALAAGSVAAGGTLGILIPPSIALILYGIVTETDIGDLFAAGALPGLLGVVLYMVAVVGWTLLDPKASPPGERYTMQQKLRSLRGVLSVAVLFAIVMGGLYGGLVTPTEAAGLGAGGAILIGLVKRSLGWAAIRDAFTDSARTSVSLLFILIGALIFTNFLNVARLPQNLGAWVSGLDVAPLTVIAAILLIYVVLGCFLESISMILLTVPIFYPIVAGLGFDLVWFGILVIVVAEISLITPPIGMNIFVLRATVPSVSLFEMYRGVLPFVAADIVRLILLVLFPAIALWLPGVLR